MSKLREVEDTASDWDPDPTAGAERVDVREHRALRVYLDEIGRAAARVVSPADYARAVEAGQQARRQRVRRNRRQRRRGL